MHNVVINNGGGGDETTLVDAVVVLGSLFMVVVVPILLYYWNKGRAHGAASPADQQASAELWDRARRMETRIEYLERVLDSEMPGWRSRS